MNSAESCNRLVSVIMNCRNSQAYLREAIDSVFAQAYTDWEIIFWDNASDDESAAIAKSYGEKLRYFRSKEALTLGEARNMAISEARGRYLAFLDCDDIWLEDKLKKQVDVLENNKDTGFLYSNYFRLFTPGRGRLMTALRGRQPEGDVFGRFLHNYPVNLQTVMIRSDEINKLGLKFDGRFDLSEDFDFFMRFLFRSKAQYLNEPLAIYRIHEGMSSQKMINKYPLEMGQALDKLKGLDVSVIQKYAPEVRYCEAKIGYFYAKAEMESHDPAGARRRLSPYKFTDIKFFVLYLLTFLPEAAWKSIHRYKMKANFL